MVVSLLLTGCVDKGPKHHEKKIDPAYVQAHLLSKAPTLTNQVNAKFGDKLIYLGNNVSTDVLAPGGKITIDHYWEVVQPPGPEWHIFAHVVGAKSQDWMNVDYTDMRVGYPASKWRAGDVIHDEQKFALSKDWTSPYADVMVGLYPKGKQKINDRMAVSGGVPGTEIDKERRVRAVRLRVDRGGKEAPRVDVIRRASGPITIDGVADEPAWKSAPESPDFTFAEGGPTGGGKTTAKLLWDDQYLYLFVHAEDADVASQYTEHDQPMWKEDVVETFIDADRSGNGYCELQVNPHNAQFDAWFPQTRRQKSHVEWTAGMKSAVKVYGTLDERDDTDQAWDIEVAIPLAAVKGMDAAMKVNIPPHVGDQWKLNVVRGEKPAKGGLIASSWNPITYGDFHALNRMLTVTFGDAQGKVEAVSAPAPAPDSGQSAAAPTEAVKSAQPVDLIKTLGAEKKAPAKTGADHAKAVRPHPVEMKHPVEVKHPVMPAGGKGP